MVITGMMTHMVWTPLPALPPTLAFKSSLRKMPVPRVIFNMAIQPFPRIIVQKAFLAALKSYGKVMKSEEILALLAAEMVK